MTDNISPELAAQIVKHYILPMFESDEKKNLKNKYNKLSSIANKQGLGGIDLKTMGNSVYGELKLSEKLNDELLHSKSLVSDLREQLEETQNTRDTYKRELDEKQAELAEYQKAL